MDVGNDSSTGDGGLDKGVQFFVTSDGELQVPWSYSLHLQVLASVARQLQHLSGQVLQDGCSVNCRCSSNSAAGANSAL